MEKQTVKDLIDKLMSLDENKDIVFWSSGEDVQIHPETLNEICIEYDSIKDRYNFCL